MLISDREDFIISQNSDAVSNLAVFIPPQPELQERHNPRTGNHGQEFYSN